MLGLKAFVAGEAVLGGIGSIPCAMIGGIAIGLCECCFRHHFRMEGCRHVLRS